MKRNISPLINGTILVVIGLLSLTANILLKTEAWRFWPVTVVLAGLGLTAPALFSARNRGLGSFFIPGLPLLTTGGILLVASLTENWGLWAWAWSLIVIALGLGFGLASAAMRVWGLVIPAVIVGMNGLFLAFCAITGLWAAWALMWPIEPLSVGIGLLILGFAERSARTRQAGMILAGIAGGGFFLTSFISVFNASMLRFAVPAMLVLTGLVLIGGYLVRIKEPAAEAEPEAEPAIPPAG